MQGIMRWRSFPLLRRGRRGLPPCGSSKGRGRLHNQLRSDMEVLDMFRITSTLDFRLVIPPKLCAFLTSTDATSKGRSWRRLRDR